MVTPLHRYKISPISPEAPCRSLRTMCIGIGDTSYKQGMMGCAYLCQSQNLLELSTHTDAWENLILYVCKLLMTNIFLIMRFSTICFLFVILQFAADRDSILGLLGAGGTKAQFGTQADIFVCYQGTRSTVAYLHKNQQKTLKSC